MSNDERISIAVAQRIIKAIAKRDQRIAELEQAINAVVELMSHSRGVSGLHLNDDVVPWGDLLAGGYMEEWLKPLSNVIDDKEGEA